MKEKRTIKIGQIDAIIRGHLRGYRPLIMWGLPGIGKTKRVRAVARQLIEAMPERDYAYLEFSPNVHIAQDFGGYPVPPSRTDEAVRLVPIELFAEAARHKRAIIYMDEANTAEPDTIAAMLRLISERMAGQIKLPDQALFIVTCNPSSYTVAARDLGNAFAERFTHYYVEADVQDFVQHFPSYWGASREKLMRIFDPIGDPDRELDLWAEKRALVASFIRSHPDALIQPPKEVGLDRDQASPNPRNWDAISAFLASAELEPHLDLEAAIVGTVGPDYAATFIHWYEQRDLPDPEQILRNPDGTPVPGRADMAYAAATSLTSYVLYRKDRPEIIELSEAAFRYLDRVARSGQADIAHVAARPLIETLQSEGKLPRLIQKLGLHGTHVLSLARSIAEQKQRVQAELKELMAQRSNEL